MRKPIAASKQLHVEEFIAAVESVGTIAGAAKAIGIDRKYVYRWIDQYPEIAEPIRQAVERGKSRLMDMLEAEATRRAMDGSDVLLIFLMKGNNPAKYRDNYNVANVDTPATYVIDLSSDDSPHIADVSPKSILGE